MFIFFTAAVLQESDMFMDALTAAAPKKEAKKRKRRLSATKEVGQSPTTESAPNDASVQPSSPTDLGLKSIAPINFYQDTLSQENGDDKPEEGKEAVENEDGDTPASPATPTDTENAMESDETAASTRTRLNGGLKGVLLFSKKKGPKRSIKWKSDDDLVEVRFFELDETERVNVTKTFNDMARMELNSEREALIMSRKLPNEDVMEAQMLWRPLILCDQPESLVVPGSKSLEKDIQFAREKASVAAFYFDKRRIPDSPEEPIPENHQISDPVQIPLDDAEGHEIDLRQTPWPEPKTTPPQIEPQIPPVFPNMPFNGNFNNMPAVPFMGVPNRFPGPPGPHGPIPPGPGNFGPPNMMPNNMMGPPMNQPDMMNPGMPMNPGMYGPGPDGFMPHVNNEPNFPMQPFNGPQGPNMMYGPNNFNHRGGRGGFRRGGNNNGGWVQLNPGQRPWQRGGGGGRGGRLCKNKQNHGYCRNEPNCPFMH